MVRFLACLLPLLLAAPGQAEELKTLHQKTLYAIGLNAAADLQGYGLKPNERAYVLMGVKDSMSEKKQLTLTADLKKRMGLLRQERWHADFNGADDIKGVKKPSGLIYREVKKGTGPSPASPSTRVKAHYHGMFTDGKVFDSSVTRGQPFASALNRVIKCWTEGIQLMNVGGKARLTCPHGIAYGKNGRGDIPGGATLIFDVELLAVNP